jgi:hypothetical protein
MRTIVHKDTLRDVRQNCEGTENASSFETLQPSYPLFEHQVSMTGKRGRDRPRNVIADTRIFVSPKKNYGTYLYTPFLALWTAFRKISGGGTVPLVISDSNSLAPAESVFVIPTEQSLEEIPEPV